MNKIQLITRLELLQKSIGNECDQDILQEIERIIDTLKTEGFTKK